MDSLTLFALIATVGLIALIGLAAKAASRKRAGGPTETPRRKRFLTDHEQVMFNRLRQALPELIVAPQISFGALLTAKSRATRNTFDRKIADFVICTRAFEVLAIVELDDSSHKGREEQDTARDKLLTGAGYRVLRYPRVPDVAQVQTDLATPSLGKRP